MFWYQIPKRPQEKQCNLHDYRLGVRICIKIGNCCQTRNKLNLLFNLFFYVVNAGILHGKISSVALQGRMGGEVVFFRAVFCCRT